jgi:hypothetical protein
MFDLWIVATIIMTGPFESLHPVLKQALQRLFGIRALAHGLLQTILRAMEMLLSADSV